MVLKYDSVFNPPTHRHSSLGGGLPSMPAVGNRCPCSWICSRWGAVTSLESSVVAIICKLQVRVASIVMHMIFIDLASLIEKLDGEDIVFAIIRQ